MLCINCIQLPIRSYHHYWICYIRLTKYFNNAHSNLTPLHNPLCDDDNDGDPSEMPSPAFFVLHGLYQSSLSLSFSPYHSRYTWWRFCGSLRYLRFRLCKPEPTFPLVLCPSFRRILGWSHWFYCSRGVSSSFLMWVCLCVCAQWKGTQSQCAMVKTLGRVVG